jgi:hypothetical protein
VTITNGYATLADFKTAVTISDTTDDTDIEAAIEAASRQIDAIANRKFWQDGSVVDRKYWPSEPCRVWVDDISTTTGLVVKVDQSGDGTFETTLTINTDFIVEPVNAAADYPVRPYECVRLLTTGQLATWPVATTGRPTVQVTAKFGWAAVPDAVERATITQARNVWKAVDAANDALQVSVEGFPVRSPIVAGMTRVSIEPYVRYTPVDNGADHY